MPQAGSTGIAALWGWEKFTGMWQDVFTRLQHNGFIAGINSSEWTASALEVVHYASFFLLIGAMGVITLRVAGVAARRHSATQVAEQLFPWVWTGLGFASVSGFLLFAGDATEYYRNSVFYHKIYIFLAAVGFTVVVRQGISNWDQPTGTPLHAKLVSLACLTAWIGTILLGVNVPAITGVG